MAIHTKHLGGQHLLCQILSADKRGGRWEAACSFSALKGKPGAPSLEERWGDKWTRVNGWLQAGKQCVQNCILLSKGEGTGSLLSRDGGKLRWGAVEEGSGKKQLWRPDQSLPPSPRGQKSWWHWPMLLGGAALLPSQRWCPCNSLTPSAASVGLTGQGGLAVTPQPTRCSRQLVTLPELSASLTYKGSRIAWASLKLG